jgi:cobalt transporter subunit CbtA
MDRFRALIVTALLAGATSGFLLFVVQHVTIIPLIDRAEVFEDAARLHAGMEHADEGWEPAAGLQRIGLTAVATMLSGIGFAAVLIAAMTLQGVSVSARRGIVWGLAGFACFVLAPALGLPPKPPGAAVGPLEARQLWWFGTVIATAFGLWMACRQSGNWGARAGGVALMLLPHAIGAPAPDGQDVVPPALMHDFALLSVATNLLFWLVLGALCGWLRDRAPRRPEAIARI